MFTSPRAFQKPSKEPIEGLETPLEKVNQYSSTEKSEENNVISPEDIQDGQSEDPDAELSMTDVEQEQTT